jgi:SEC-C motif
MRKTRVASISTNRDRFHRSPFLGYNGFQTIPTHSKETFTMDSKNVKRPSSIRLYNEPEPEPVNLTEPVAAPDHGPFGPQDLVKKMVAAGEWPPPELLKQILATGEAAVEPLIEVVRSDLRGWPDEASICHAIGLLRMLRPPAAIPALMDVVRGYTEDACEEAVYAFANFGDPGFDALLELCRDPSLGGYERNMVSEEAVYVAGDDPLRKSRLAEILRSLLEDRMAKAREELRLKGKLEMIPPDDLDDEELDDLDEDEADDDDDELGDDLDEDDLLNEDEDLIEPFIAEEIGHIIGDLANLADPLALDLIETAYEEGLVDEGVITRTTVDEWYQGVDEAEESESEDSPSDWLSAYEEDYQLQVEAPEQEAAPAPREQSWRRAEPWQIDKPDPPALPLTAPIRNTGPKLGRNDPCWCGSGKKYKKCHLGREESV